MDQAAFTHLPPQGGLSGSDGSSFSAHLHAPAQYQQPPSALQAGAQALQPAPSSSSAAAAALAPGTRPARSRRQRPCDSCRGAKRRCFKDDNSPCVACQAMGAECTFLEPPHKRSRLAPGEAGGSAGEGADGAADKPPRKANGASAAKGKKRVVDDLDDGGGEDDDDHESAESSTGPGPQTQRMKYEQAHNTDLMTAHATASSTATSSRVSFGATTSSALQDAGEHSRIMMPTYQAPSSLDGPLAKILNRSRIGGAGYDQSERSTSQQHDGSQRQGQSPPPEDELSHPALDQSRLAASEPHFSAASAAEDPSLNFMASRVREVASTQGSGSVNKIFFVQAPSLVYPKVNGHGAATDLSGGIAPLIRSLKMLGKDHPEALLETFINVSLPAIPLLNLNRFQHHLRSYPMSEMLYPSRILTGILAHATMYTPELRAKQAEIWVEVYETLTHEFLQPRLQTIQLTLLDLISRPDKNPGGNSIALARAVGAAQLLGLHLDCSTWQLPRWEKNLRKRLFWILFVMDKWASLYQGRPPNIHSSQYNVPYLKLDDFDSPYAPTTPSTTTSPSHAFSPASSQHNGSTMTQAAIDSAHSFIALSKLSVIAEELSEEFFSVKAQNLGGAFPRIRASRAGRQQKLRVIESFGGDLDRFERELPDRLKLTYQYSPGEGPATGIKSMQLSYLGLTIVLGRLTGDLFDVLDEEGDFAAPLTTGLDLTDQVVQFLERLTPTDLTSVFWISFTPYHLSNALSLLIRCLLACRRIGHAPLLVRSIALLQRFINVLKEHHRPPYCWDIAERGLAKLLTLMPSVSRLCPEVGQIWAEHSDEIWAQMRASPTADILVSAIPNNGMPPHAPAHAAPTMASSAYASQAAHQSAQSMPPPTQPAAAGYTGELLAPRPSPSSSSAHSAQQLAPVFDKPEDVEQYFSSILQNPVSYQAFHGQGPAFSQAVATPSSRPGSAANLGIPSDRAFPSRDDLSFETPFEIAVGEEDLWASVGDNLGTDWMMGLGDGSPPS